MRLPMNLMVAARSPNAVIEALFAAGEQGAWYDPSDFSTMFQDAAGTTPVTAVEQPVGLILDKSMGLVLGAELVTNGGFDTDTGWTNGTGITISGGCLVFTSAAGTYASQTVSGTADEAYCEVTLVVSSVSSGAIGFQLDMAVGSEIRITSPGTYTYRRKQYQHYTNLYVMSYGTTTAQVDSVSVKKVTGNHASQSTTTKRPILRARHNLLTYSEQFDNAAWTKQEIGIQSVSSGVQKITPTAVSGVHYVSSSVAGTTIGGAFFSVEFKASGYSKVGICESAQTGSFATANLQTGQLITIETGCKLEPLADGWYRLSYKVFDDVSHPGIGFWLIVALPDSYVSGPPGAHSFVGDGSSGVLVRNAQVGKNTSLVANFMTTFVCPTYQRIAAATDYDTVGFPHYFDFDGTDDSLATASIDFTATDKMSVFAGFKTSDESGFEGLVQLGTVASGGFWTYTGNNALEFKTQGSTGISAINAAYAPSATSVLTVSANLAGATGADCLSLRKNGASLASATVVAGAANYQNAALKIGEATGVYLLGRIYGLIILGRTATAAEITATETWVANKTGVTL